MMATVVTTEMIMLLLLFSEEETKILVFTYCWHKFKEESCMGYCTEESQHMSVHVFHTSYHVANTVEPM